MTDQPAAPKRRKSEKRFRNKTVQVKLSDKEFDEVQEKANRLGGDPGPNSQRRPSVEKQQLLRLLALLGHINHRIDQSARNEKQGDVPDLGPILQDYADARHEILAFLQRCRELGLALHP